MKKVALLYICTGKYYVFWEDYYRSCEKYFLKHCEVHYYVFTDAKEIYSEDNNRVHKIYAESMPWPLATLLRFHTFLTIEEDLKEYDYIYFMNANIQCVQEIQEDEFLPLNGEDIVVTQHPGFYKNKSRFVGSFDRNPHSTAYIPYNAKGDSVIGAMIGGTGKGFLQMSRELKHNIDIDLQNRVIAMWHDESHLNHYIMLHKNYKLLTPAFCYAEELDLPFEKKILMTDKKKKFDVNRFKGYAEIKETLGQKIWRNINKIIPYQNILCIRDAICMKKVK